MTHDKIKAAARKRMAASGEPYTLARRGDITRHSGSGSTSAIGPEDVRAAAEVHQELGSVYSDAVVASFIDKVDREVAARVEARLAGMRRPKPAKQRGPRRLLRRRIVRDAVAASAGALAVAGAMGLHGLASSVPHSGVPVHAGVVPATQVAPTTWILRARTDGSGRTLVWAVTVAGPPPVAPGAARPRS
jgi:hypothetical protein